MNIPLGHTATSLLVAIAWCAAVPALAQTAAPAPAAPAATAATAPGYGGGTNTVAPKNGRAAHRASEEKLLGAPQEYGTADAPQRNTVDAQQAALLDEQRMSMTGRAPGALPPRGKGQRFKAPAAANGNARVAGQPRPTANDALMPAAAAKATYADPYNLTGTGNHGVYRSPW
ncbi:hypothetical protein [Paraburkholderia sp. SIMBA_030]|uniref:hypothetical protein n=1 Tax=Paraburkholderia sp. SIMBA_030 TaxID=3085773 RepID=UPI00397C98F1